MRSSMTSTVRRPLEWRESKPRRGAEQFRLALPARHVQKLRRGDVLVELRDGHPRVEEVGDEHGAVEPVHHPAQDGRLPRPDLARDDDEALAALDAVVQVRHRLRVRGREVDEPRVGREREREFFQSVEIKVHLQASEVISDK